MCQPFRSAGPPGQCDLRKLGPGRTVQSRLAGGAAAGRGDERGAGLCASPAARKGCSGPAINEVVGIEAKTPAASSAPRAIYRNEGRILDYRSTKLSSNGVTKPVLTVIPRASAIRQRARPPTPIAWRGLPGIGPPFHDTQVPIGGDPHGTVRPISPAPSLPTAGKFCGGRHEIGDFRKGQFGEIGGRFSLGAWALRENGRCAAAR